jgi:ubiquinone/menaquinone biosynthesis C-methylase UbiE
MENKNQAEELADDVASGISMNDKNSFVDPRKIIKIAGIKRGDKVADFGCGAGYFSIPIAVVVGDGGEVYAFDVLPSAIEATASYAKVSGVDNVITKRVNLEKENGTILADGSVDWVIIKDVLFQNKGRQIILKEANRVLRSGGNILVMEWNNNSIIGPERKTRLDIKDVMEMIFSQGFVFKKQSTAGDYHYVIVATKV